MLTREKGGEGEEGRNAVPFNCYQIIKLEQKKKNITDGVIGAKLVIETARRFGGEW